MLKVYRIRHKQTGLYYTPRHKGRSNLSSKGKIYWNKPSFELVRMISFDDTKYEKTNSSDWQIEEYHFNELVKVEW